MPDVRPSYGPAVKDGQLQFVSPSSIRTFSDPKFGCQRRWWFRYVLRIPDPPTELQALGDHYHREIKRYVETGDVGQLSPVTLPARDYLPPGFENVPGWVGTEIPIDGELTLDGIPVVGSIDILQRGEQPMVLDWKFTNRNLKKIEVDLMEGVQMPAYGMAVGTDVVVLRHVYISMREPGKHHPVTQVVTRQELQRRWADVVPVTALMRDVARVTDPVTIQPNYAACKRCPYTGRCPREPGGVLEAAFGRSPGPKGERVSLLDKIPKYAQVTPPANGQATLSIVPPDVPAPAKTAEPLPAEVVAQLPARVQEAVIKANAVAEPKPQAKAKPRKTGETEVEVEYKFNVPPTIGFGTFETRTFRIRGTEGQLESIVERLEGIKAQLKKDATEK